MNLARLLRHTRTERRISQLELALRLGVSQRHVSFLELGRARPSRTLLLSWMQELDAEPSLVNAALVQAGFDTAAAPSAGAAPSAAALDEMLRVLAAHEPFPAVVFNVDRYVLHSNRSGRWMWSLLMPRFWSRIESTGEAMDMIEALMHEDGMLSHMPRPGGAARAFLGLLQREVWLRPALEPRVAAFAEHVARRYGAAAQGCSALSGNPQCEFAFDTALGPMTFMLVQSIVGLPQDITVETPRLELWFPADEATRRCVQRHAPRSRAAGEAGGAGVPAFAA